MAKTGISGSVSAGIPETGGFGAGGWSNLIGRRQSAARHLRNMAAVGTGAARPALHSARRRKQPGPAALASLGCGGSVFGEGLEFRVNYAAPQFALVMIYLLLEDCHVYLACVLGLTRTLKDGPSVPTSPTIFSIHRWKNSKVGRSFQGQIVF